MDAIHQFYSEIWENKMHSFLSLSSALIFLRLHGGNIWSTQHALMQLRGRTAQWDYLETLTDL